MGVATKLVQQARELEPRQFRAFVKESLEQKKFDISDHGQGARFHVRECAEAAFNLRVGEGLEPLLKGLSVREAWVTEAATGATDASVFRDTLRTVATAKMMEGYEQRESALMDLPGTLDTPDLPETEFTEIAEYNAVGPVQAVAPGTEYPRTDFANYNTTAPPPVKYGSTAVLTLEAVKANNSRGFLKQNADVGRLVKAHKLDSLIRVMIGLVNNYKRNGTSYNAYQTSGAWKNRITNFDANNGPAEFNKFGRLFDLMVHPVTGRSIDIAPTALVPVGNAKFTTASTINATQIRTVAGNVTTIGSNPLTDMPPMKTDANIRRILVNEGGYTEAQADTMIFVGDFAEGIKERVVEPFTVFEAGAAEAALDVGFFQDIVYAAKGRWWGVYFWADPMRVIQAYSAAAA